MTLTGLRLASGCNSSDPAQPIGATRSVGDPPFDAAPIEAAPPPCDQIPMPDGAAVHLSGIVTEPLDPDASAPPPKVIPNAMISVEYGGIYLCWRDLGSASPYYVFGALSDDAGRFEIDVKEGLLGFHSFANDHLYRGAAFDTADAGDAGVTLRMVPLADAQAQPTARAAGFDKTTVAPGELVTYSAILATWSPKDPLSDESVLVEATRSWSLELNPPAVGKKDDFADGIWRRTFPAPTVPGTYTYWFSATTSQCVTTNLVSSTLTVR